MSDEIERLTPDDMANRILSAEWTSPQMVRLADWARSALASRDVAFASMQAERDSLREQLNEYEHVGPQPTIYTLITERDAARESLRTVALERDRLSVDLHNRDEDGGDQLREHRGTDVRRCRMGAAMVRVRNPAHELGPWILGESQSETVTDEQRQRVSDPLAIAWLRDMAHADETCPEEPTDDGHARNALEALERKDIEIARLTIERDEAHDRIDVLARRHEEDESYRVKANEERDAALARAEALERALANAMENIGQ